MEGYQDHLDYLERAPDQGEVCKIIRKLLFRRLYITRERLLKKYLEAVCPDCREKKEIKYPQAPNGGLLS